MSIYVYRRPNSTSLSTQGRAAKPTHKNPPFSRARSNPLPRPRPPDVRAENRNRTKAQARHTPCGGKKNKKKKKGQLLKIQRLSWSSSSSLLSFFFSGFRLQARFWGGFPCGLRAATYIHTYMWGTFMREAKRYQRQA